MVNIKEEDIINDAVNTVAALAEKNGVAISEALRTEAEQIIRAKWRGDRPYIQMKRDFTVRNNAIRVEYAKGERVPFLMRKYRLSKSAIHLILREKDAST